MSLDRYVLESVLFEAAPSTFYAARNAILGNEVTVRRLTLDPERPEDAKDTFFREQRLAASLAHPRIQRPVDIFQADGAVWSVHERGEVHRTDDRVEREGPLSLTEAMRLGSQMAEALSHVHAAGLVFGRMSPASVLVSTRGDAELINLVKAADMKAGIWPLRPPVQALSAFSAPEEIEGERPTVASDVYSLAATRMLDAPVVEARLSYCTARGGFVDRVVPVNEWTLLQAQQVLQRIDRAVQDGHLMPAPKRDACRWCDFRTVCGPHEEVRTARKDPALLEELRDLREQP